MLEIAISSLTLSVFHAMIPNHWIPLITIAKAEHWSRKETLGITLLTGLAHSFGTILLGIGLGALGIQLAQQFDIFAELIAPLVLIIIGLVYLTLTEHAHKHFPKNIRNKDSKSAIVFALALSMFLSPCLEMESYFLVAAEESWLGIALVSVIFLFATTLIMLLLVYLGYNGIERLKWNFLEKHEKHISGIILILIGAFTLLYNH
jgi:cytochrome c biogenesis protein CcdA